MSNSYLVRTALHKLVFFNMLNNNTLISKVLDLKGRNVKTNEIEEKNKKGARISGYGHFPLSLAEIRSTLVFKQQQRGTTDCELFERRFGDIEPCKVVEMMVKLYDMK